MSNRAIVTLDSNGQMPPARFVYYAPESNELFTLAIRPAARNRTQPLQLYVEQTLIVGYMIYVGEL